MPQSHPQAPPAPFPEAHRTLLCSHRETCGWINSDRRAPLVSNPLIIFRCAPVCHLFPPSYGTCTPGPACPAPAPSSAASYSTPAENNRWHSSRKESRRFPRPPPAVPTRLCPPAPRPAENPRARQIAPRQGSLFPVPTESPLMGGTWAVMTDDLRATYYICSTGCQHAAK